MKAIHKYPLQLRLTNLIPIPSGTEFLCVQMQHDIITIWALVETENPATTRAFWIIGTGQEIPADLGKTYLGTVQQCEGALVWHVFLTQ